MTRPEGVAGTDGGVAGDADGGVAGEDADGPVARPASAAGVTARAAPRRRPGPSGVRAGLRDQEQFLVRSIADLDREHAAGDLTDDDHQRLRTEYEGRLADVRDALVAGRVPATSARQVRGGAPAPPAGRGRAVALLVGIVVFAVVAGVLFAGAVGRRDPGQAASGLDPRDAEAQERAAAQGELSECITLDRDQDVDEAALCYDAYVERRPDDPAGLAYFGWFLFRIGDASQEPQLVDQAVAFLSRATDVGPDFDEGFALSAVVSGRIGDLDGAAADLAVLDSLEPDEQLLGLVEAVRQRLAEAGVVVPPPPPPPPAPTVPDAPPSTVSD